ncbi:MULTISPECIES: transglutaminase family protein [Rhodobacterales]|uniref:transglutaminase family protein n=1 Tax=Roseobacter sp. N2S TaxID=2663844 RepID=UPI002859304D|nr:MULTISPECIES: transglutaminase family protein [Rhodobacterales]MDR6263090.1 transglutaminase-like putative cysteine protease [Roseobacter sp. N2S]
MQLYIHHRTEYAYSAPVGYALQKLRLRPVTSVLQEVQHWQVALNGGKFETAYTDHYGNQVDLVSITPGADKILIEAKGTIVTPPNNGVFGKTYGCAPLWHFKHPTQQTLPGPAIREIAGVIGQSADTLDGLHALSAAILKAAPYQIGATHSNTTAEDALVGGLGVCQDHAQIFVAAARAANVPARYVSGYLMMNDTVNQDASHAWAEAHIDSLGWVGFDVSNGYSPDERYARIAIGRDARDASPVEGLRIGPADETLIVSLQVQQ